MIIYTYIMCIYIYIYVYTYIDDNGHHITTIIYNY